jgi:hypothetical protein
MSIHVFHAKALQKRSERPRVQGAAQRTTRHIE